MRFILTLWLAKCVAHIVSLIDEKRGSNYSGKIAVKLMPQFVALFKNIDYNKVYFISGTNGKSTTTNLIYHTLISSGRTVACNTEGANMMTGVATTLIKNSTWNGKFNKEYLVLEIDERSFPGIRTVLPGKNLGLTNLQKDQVQRNGDPDFILRKIRNAISSDMTLYLNNEEPRSCSLGDFVEKTVLFSIEHNAKSNTSDDFYNVTLPCPKCGHPIGYQYYNLANIGAFSCTRCKYSSNPRPQVRISEVDFEGKTFVTDDTHWRVPYNNPFYLYNFAMCIAICRNIGLTDREIQTGFLSFTNPASHEDVIPYKGKEIHYLRGKQENPEALQSQLDIIAADHREKAVYVGMYRVSDFHPHYSGSFYLFDCDFESVVDSGVSKFVAFSESLAGDIASRMILAGANPDQVTIIDSDEIPSVFKTLDEIDVPVVYVLTNTVHAKEIKAFLRQGGNSND